jgi:hypothetical protein
VKAASSREKKIISPRQEHGGALARFATRRSQATENFMVKVT